MDDDEYKFSWAVNELRHIADEFAEGAVEHGSIDALKLRLEIDAFRRLIQEVHPPDLRKDLFNCVAVIGNAALILGIRRSNDLNPHLKHKAENEKAASARKAKKEKAEADPREKVLKDAIMAKGGVSLSEKPFESGKAILDDVNKRLQDAGYGLVSSTTIGRRIISLFKSETKG